MIAIALLMLAIIAPMALTIQSLASAYYARDQITASNLAQEGIESVIDIVDGNILITAEGTGSPNLFNGITAGQWFTIDTIHSNAITYTCSSGAPAPGGANWQTSTGCPYLQTNGTFYGYSSGWTNTAFQRSLYACYIQSGGGCSATPTDEMRLTVVVNWKSGDFQVRSIALQENLYRWVD